MHWRGEPFCDQFLRVSHMYRIMLVSCIALVDFGECGNYQGYHNERKDVKKQRQEEVMNLVCMNLNR